VISGGGSCPGKPSFNVQVTANNAQTTSFSISNGGSQSVTLGGGSFIVRKAAAFGFTPSFFGDCMQSSSNSQEATGTSAAGAASYMYYYEYSNSSYRNSDSQ